MFQNEAREQQRKRGVYITNTLRMINSFHRRAKRTKIAFQAFSITIGLGSLLIPVFVNLPGITIVTIQWGTTVVGLIVAGLISIEKVLNLREKWVIYNSMSLFIDKEYHFYIHKIRDYKRLEDEDAFNLYVDNIETELTRQHFELLHKEARSDAGSSS